MTASPETLEEIVTDVGQAPWLWGHSVTVDPERRSHRVLYKTPQLEIALFGWAAGQETLFHDHGGASGAANSALMLKMRRHPSALTSRR